jgi:hypothetical protein
MLRRPHALVHAPLTRRSMQKKPTKNLSLYEYHQKSRVLLDTDSCVNDGGPSGLFSALDLK